MSADGVHCGGYGARVVTLVTERLVLRPIGAQDVPDLVALEGDPEVMRHLDPGVPEELVQPDWRWVAHDAEGAFVGWFAMQPTGAGTYELGYRLRSDRWGSGLATEGARALLDRAVADGAVLVHAQTMAVNTASRRVLEKCGLVHVDTLFLQWDQPLPGSDLGEVVYELRP
jgi:RimJ/RimL family protein N-acetyltransferase